MTRTFPGIWAAAQAEHLEVFGKLVLDSPKMYAIIKRNQEGRPQKEQCILCGGYCLVL